jgi:SAM-dependent methyltransferase
MRGPPTNDPNLSLTAIARLRERMNGGYVPKDREFDRYLSLHSERRSGQYWTPLQVCSRAAEWFCELGIRSVCDIGSGAGKFCVATALFGDASFVGIEHRQRLVGEARCLAELFGVHPRVQFSLGNLGEVAVPHVDAYYFFNPFGENVFREDSCLDRDVELSTERYLRDVDESLRILMTAPVHTFLLTYNGLGEAPPDTYQKVREDPYQRNPLILWQKSR